MSEVERLKKREAALLALLDAYDAWEEWLEDNVQGEGGVQIYGPPYDDVVARFKVWRTIKGETQ